MNSTDFASKFRELYEEYTNDSSYMFAGTAQYVSVFKIIDIRKVKRVTDNIVNEEFADYYTDLDNFLPVIYFEKSKENCHALPYDHYDARQGTLDIGCDFHGCPVLRLHKSIEKAYYNNLNTSVLTGLYFCWYADGSKYTQGNYFKGQKNGFWQTWRNDKLESKGEFVNGNPVGTWTYYDNDGSVEKEEIYKGDSNKCTLRKWIYGKPFTIKLEGSNIVTDDYYQKCASKYIFDGKYKYMSASISNEFLAILQLTPESIIKVASDVESPYEANTVCYECTAMRPVCIFNKFNPDETYHAVYNDCNGVTVVLNNNINSIKCYKSMEVAFYEGLDKLPYFGPDNMHKIWNTQGVLTICIRNGTCDMS